MAQLQAASSEVQVERLEELLERRAIKAIAQEELCKLVQDELQITPNRLRHLMLDLGWTSEKKKWGGEDHRRMIWLRPGMTLHLGKLTDRAGNRFKIGTDDTVEPEDIEIIDTDVQLPGPTVLAGDDLY
jgi:hypothetical protein